MRYSKSSWEPFYCCWWVASSTPTSWFLCVFPNSMISWSIYFSWNRLWLGQAYATFACLVVYGHFSPYAHSFPHRFIPEAWSSCSVTCGVGSQVRLVKCQVLLSFSQSVADLPIDECEGPKPVSQRACYSGPCSGEATEYTPEETDLLYGSFQEFDELYDWEYEGFTECSESCGGGKCKMFLCCTCFLSLSACFSVRTPMGLFLWYIYLKRLGWKL